MIRAVLFDVDGTLIDSMPMWNHCGERYLAARGIKADPGLAEEMKYLPIGESGKLLKARYRLPESPEEITAGLNADAYRFYMREAKPKPYILPLTGALGAAGVLMAVDTASAQSVIDAVLRRFGIRDRFAAVLTCDEIGLGKTDPRFFAACADRLGVPPETVTVFEDMPHAAKAARDAGMTVVGVYDAENGREEPLMRELCHRFLKDRRDFDSFCRAAVGLPLPREEALL